MTSTLATFAFCLDFARAAITGVGRTSCRKTFATILMEES
jgi:hypothetical protein